MAIKRNKSNSRARKRETVVVIGPSQEAIQAAMEKEQQMRDEAFEAWVNDPPPEDKPKP
jgi:hypothetical protein